MITYLFEHFSFVFTKKVATLIEEKNTLQAENDHLMEKIDTGDSLDDPR